MRLTLRTLLAYLDGILEPNDSQDLGKKIEESEYATGLVHRVRDVMRRLRLGAPSLNDRGPGLDPNTVAEYLDNTLATERVTDFEKVCLDSDVHLAEVASCHQILTLVLGEPAEVAPSCREQIYQLKDVPAAANLPHAPPALPPTPAFSAVTTPPSLDLEGDGESARRKARPRPTVPEYLREPRKRPAWLAVAAAVALAVCLTVVMLFAFNQFEQGAFLGDLLVRCGMLADSRQVAAVKGQKGEENGEKEEGRGDSSRGPTAPGDAANSSNAEAQKPVKETPAAEAASKPPVKPATQPGGETSKQSPASPQAPTVKETPVKPETEEPPVKANSGPETPPSTTAPNLLPKPSTPPDAKPPVAPDDKTAKATPVETTPPGEGSKTPEAKPTAEPPAIPPESMGRFMSRDQVLLGAIAGSDWTRVSPDQMLIPQQLLVLPTYRVNVALTIGVTLEILGPARIELLGTTPQAPPGIRVLYGRVVMMPLGKADSRLRLALGDHSGTLAFADPDSTAAIDVRRVREPGTSPEGGPSRVAADLYVSTGGVSWEEATAEKGAEPLRLTPLQRLSFDAQTVLPPVAVKDVPKWITAEPLKFSDRKASPVIALGLPTDRPARIGLLEATSKPQKEVKWLAIRCLGYVGQFRDMVAALNDPARKLDWADYYIEELRAAVGRDAETAATVRLALEQQYPQQAADLYRMLWGYSNRDLDAGEDAKLVQGLKDENCLAIRVLAFWNLKDITGKGLNYQPEERTAKRQFPTHRWEERLANKEIRLKTPDEKPGPAAREKPRPVPPGAGPTP
jgi:hypothetical protein